MIYSRKCFIIVLLFYSILIMRTGPTHAQAGSIKSISDALPQLKKISAEINQNVLPLLALIKKIDESGPSATFKIAKIIKPQVSVRETDNSNASVLTEARMNEEFVIIEERDKWYKIRTPDSREGWVAEEDVQVIVKQGGDMTVNLEKFSKEEASALLSQIKRYKETIEDLYSGADNLIKNTETEYNRLSAAEKKSVESDYKTFSDYKAKIEKYYGYAIRFTAPYEKILLSPGGPEPSKVAPGDRFKGTISADMGRSSYQNMNSSSTTSRRLAFAGNYQIDKNTRLDFGLNHQNELIQTAFSNNALNAAITRQFSEKVIMGADLNYNNYNDKVSDQNSFGHLRAGVNARLNPSKKANIFVNTSYQTKNFTTPDNNDYEGLTYVLGANLSPDLENNIRIQIQGNSQSGEKGYLTFNQVSPMLTYTHRKGKEKTFSLGLDYDMLRFEETNNLSDYQKYKADLRWRRSLDGKLLSRIMNLTMKQYPNNPDQDYYRLGYVMESRTGSLREGRSSVSSYSYLINVFAQRYDNPQRDYIDLRWDRSGSRPKSFSTMNVLTRLWNNLDMFDNDTTAFPDHYIDFYGEFGPYFRNVSEGTVKIDGLKIGLIMGGHMFFNFDDEYFNRNGNSVRGGIIASSNIKIYKGSLLLAGTYERSLVLTKQTTYDPFSGNIVYGDDLFRKPSSFQFNIDYRQPVKNNWDIHLNLSTYEVRTDATFETSINPVEKKSSLRFSGGLVYKFTM
jgi:SH3-like domain-containing protein